MDVDVSAEIVIDRTRDDVATYVENPEKQAGVDRRQLSPNR